MRPYPFGASQSLQVDGEGERVGSSWTSVLSEASMTAHHARRGVFGVIACAVLHAVVAMTARGEASRSVDAVNDRTAHRVANDDAAALSAADRRGILRARERARYQVVNPLAQQAYVKASNTALEDFFGDAVAVSGDTVVVGANGEDSAAVGVNGNDADDTALGAGAAYVFVRTGGGWSQQAYLKASNTENGDLFGSAVAISGNTIVVGAPYEDSAATGVNGNQGNGMGDPGAAYVFTRTAGVWSQQAYLKASNTGANDYFGQAVAISGDIIVVGAYYESSAATGVNGNQLDNSASNSGAAYVFARTGGLWSQEAYLKASNTNINDYFGESVAVSGATVVIGAPGEDSASAGVNGDQNDNSLADPGAAYVFVRSAGVWSQQAYLKASNPDTYDSFGWVAAAGDTIAVGAYGEGSAAIGVNGNQADNSMFAAGAVYIFTRTAGIWAQQAYLKASNTDAEDLFGVSVSMTSNAVLVGAPGEDSTATGVNGNQVNNSAGNSGAAYRFVRSGTTWTQQAYLKASNTGGADAFGAVVGMSGGVVAVGATQESSSATGVNGNQTNDNARWSGAAYVFVNSPLSSTLTSSPSGLAFAATKNGLQGPLVSVTPPQNVTIGFTGTVPAWSASSDQPWLQVSNAEGTGAGAFTASIVNPANVIGGATVLYATITLSAPTAYSLQIPVTLSVDQTGTSTAAAFGQVDTPAQNATNQVGAIGVTGWAIDDVGVMSVKIYRTCLAFDNPASCQIVLGQNVVFVGDAAFLAGARPDVEAAFPGYPFSYRAGWGMQILTNMLPNLPAAQLYGGQGTLTLYAVATDVEGHATLLGRTSADSTPTTIAMNNNAIAKPFGTADTPLLGATVSGTLPAFLWALTPDTDTVAGNGDIQINPNGSTMVLFVDGVATAPVAFNQCRGTVGNPPPAGVYCDDDVANVFGNATPQAPLTPRTSNPTRFRNLDAGRGAIGVNVIDTTLLANGLHTVAWSVTDSAGRVEGIGSRFFTVLNGGGSLAERIVTLVDVLTAPAVARGRAASLDGVRVSRRLVSVRTGYDLQTPMTALAADRDGVRHVTVPPLGRLEIGLANAATGGYLEANGELRDLPPGSHLNRATGVFTWMPPSMYLGTYRLVFLIGGERVVVSVRLGER
jgi:hypothetical protein